MEEWLSDDSVGKIARIRIPAEDEVVEKPKDNNTTTKTSGREEMAQDALEAWLVHQKLLKQKKVRFRSPFTDDINLTPVPKGLKGPRIKMYDGTEDPDDHVSNFHWAIKMIPMDEKLWSLYFAGTLDGSARY